MGGCLSSKSSSSSSSSSADHSSRRQNPSAYVVSANGQLRQYAVPITVSQVIETSTESSSVSFFLCNSDRLHFDDYIPSLHPNEELQPAQIYFLLPAARLRYRLAASDMAALAVKASVALDQIDASNRSRGNRKSRISPVLVVEEDHSQSSNHEINQLNIKSSGGGDYKKKSAASSVGGFSRSGSVARRNHKLARYSSQRAKLAIRSFRHRLTTIYEGGSMHRSSSSNHHEIQPDQQFTSTITT